MVQTLDPFRLTNKLDASALDVMVMRLEARGRHPFFATRLSDYLDRMAIDDKCDVLDLGCGTGVAARTVAQRPGFKGSVLGIDQSEYLVQAATRLAANERLSSCVRFETGDSHHLRNEPASFDAAIAHTLFSHLNDPAKVLREMRRVVRPGGVIAIFDGDYASMTFQLSDDERSRQMDEVVIGSLVTHPRILRGLPRLFKEAGFAIEAVLPGIMTEVGVADFWKSTAEAYAKLVPRAEIASEPEMTAWLDELLDASAKGVFFASCVYYAYVARAI